MKIVRTNEVQWAEGLNRGNYANRRKELGGGEKLSCGLWELAPGKKSFPLHAHKLTDEALYVVSGRAKVRTPEGLTPIGPGDFVSFPAGGPAHQLINDGTEALLYVAMSANAADADIVTYPETGKIAARVGKPPTGMRVVFRQADAADYFEGDKDA